MPSSLRAALFDHTGRKPSPSRTIESALPSSALRMSSALRQMESLPSIPIAAERTTGQGVVVHVRCVAGHIEAADYLAALAVYGRGGAGPGVMGAAVVLGPGHLYGRIRVERHAYSVRADAHVVPQRARDEAQVAALREDALVAHRLKHIARASVSTMRKPRGGARCRRRSA